MQNILNKKSRWAWILCGLLLAGFLTNSISDYLVARDNVRKTITQSTLPLTSDNVYSEIQRDLLSPIFIASLMASDTFLRDWVIAGEQDESSIVRYLHEIKIEYSTVTSFFVSEKSRNYYYAHGLLKEIREGDPRDEWYFRVREMSEPYEINVDSDMANRDQMTIFINYRVKDYAGNFIGATGVGLTVNKVNNLISSYEARYNRQIYFVNQSGDIVLSPTNSPMLKYKGLHDIRGLKNHAEALLSGKVQSLDYYRDGHQRILNCRYVPELNWYLIVEQSEDELLTPLRRQLYVNVTTAILMTAIIAGICIYVIRAHHFGIEAQNRELTEQKRLILQQKEKLDRKTNELETANEKLRALNFEKDEFLGIVAHDLRNPLNSIIGISELEIGETAQTGSESRSFSLIKESGEQMNSLLGELLDVSRIEAFQGQVEKDRIEWNQLLESGIGQLSKRASEKNIEVLTQIETTQGILVDGIADWMNSIVNNLLSNALKFSPPFSTITISTDRNENRLITRFIDHGPGIKDAEQNKLFQKFARLSARPTGNETSTGLGLYIVKKMCDRLGIAIRTESQYGSGTTFILEQEVSGIDGPKEGDKRKT
jgi:signal transduction histidine kinase